MFNDDCTLTVFLWDVTNHTGPSAGRIHLAHLGMFQMRVLPSLCVCYVTSPAAEMDGRLPPLNFKWHFFLLWVCKYMYRRLASSTFKMLKIKRANLNAELTQPGTYFRHHSNGIISHQTTELLHGAKGSEVWDAPRNGRKQQVFCTANAHLECALLNGKACLKN